ncbi:UDP-N-acetylmuramoyl-tripeptide--D-alanyl-D-alanine ligase [Cyanobium sp. PCC 7001]|uniref:UDP-N-acetylmuramoyl-tripeptide--D-alanyl-D- alanine ligase n=1 Tax=Cyanobium sp. PCC 7001 TaxID=180281 RepID=UPI00018049BE|nr:Mur ligase family protein [Cyanobium sp. PCC 7001]EDY38177.1 UDP-N-acetylmuramoyl-tripeptide--D-alanyl-D-alanine ligase [Cyanobium sp. PCC 7001]
MGQPERRELLFDSSLLDTPSVSGGWWLRPQQRQSYTGVSYLPGDIQPGHLYVQPSALSWGRGYDKDRESLQRVKQRGARAVVLDAIPAEVPEGLSVYLAPDTSLALAQLGQAARALASHPLVCVTGTVGKSTTKRGLAILLARCGRTHESQRNFNHYHGVTLTLADTPKDTEFSVLEFSSDLPRYTLPKALIAAPDVAVITEIQYDHTDCYPTLEAIADQKSLLFRGLKPEGTAVLNRDSPYFARMHAAARSYGAARVLTFGCSPLADVALQDCSRQRSGWQVRARCLDQSLTYTLPLPGRHDVRNSLAMLAGVVALGQDPNRCLAAFSALQPLPRHCALEHLAVQGGEVRLIDDSFSSNPASLRAALETLALQAEGSPGRRLLVLGAIDELGERSDALHASLADLILLHRIDRVYAYGSHTRHTCAALPDHLVALHTTEARELTQVLMADLQPDDWLVLKFSRHSRLGELLGQALRTGATTQA